VNPAATTTALTSSTSSSLPGQAVTFTAAVTSPAGTPTGVVTFASDSSPLGTVAFTGGHATLTASLLAIGDHTIAASYAPDANFITSNTTLAFTVNKIAFATFSVSTIPGR
jgi:hypothetical protein